MSTLKTFFGNADQKAEVVDAMHNTLAFKSPILYVVEVYL